MRKFILAASVAGMVLCGMGCEKSDVPTSNVAVIDINRLYEDTGQESVARGKMNAQYSAIINTLAAKSPKHITPAQFEQSLRDPKMQALAAQINQRMGEMNSQLKNQFFTAVQPVIMKVVKDRGVTLLIQWPNPFVLQYDPATEVTDDVLKAINEDTSIFAEGTPGTMPSGNPEAPGTPGTAGTPPAPEPQGMAPESTPAPTPAAAPPATQP